MSLFQPSTKVISDAVREIADCVGASADDAMANRAGRSLNAALQHFNTRANWNFMLTEAAPVTVFAPFTVVATASAGAVSAACPTGHGILPEDMISAVGFITGLRVSATAASGFGFYVSASGFTGTATATVTVTRDTYALPGDWNQGYTFRLLNAGLTLRPVGRRLYDRTIGSEQTTSSSYWYDLFLSGGKGRIRLLPPPASSDVLLARYYRRMTMMSSALGTADGATLDIPQDFEIYLLAYAKWHFITDKSEGRGEQLKTWYALSQEGLQMMVRDQTRVPDEDLMFVPGATTYSNYGDNTTRFIDWTYS